MYLKRINRVIDLALMDVLTPPKMGKTTGPEHRLMLYAMLAMMLPSTEVLATVIQNVPQLLMKEMNDTAIGVLVLIMAVHLTFILKANMEVLTHTTAVIAMEMTNTKPVVRRAFVSIAGSALWNIDRVDANAVLAFSMGITSALETNLKVVTTNPLTATVGPLEGICCPCSVHGSLDRYREV
ncbi:hypothetical protein BDR06DRAFT_1055412 [Suillus hirtellus]|nr:hypothetical protein BDR06DRAFT_1055412 [Suillus hirtellus]